MFVRRLSFAVALIVAIAACSKDSKSPTGVTTPPKPDPFLTIRVLDQMDTTTLGGRAGWRLYLFITSAQVNQTGEQFVGSFSMTDVRLKHTLVCMRIGADSIGQRFVQPFALGDTAHSTQQPDAAYDSIAKRWYAGDHTAPAGMIVLTTSPIDAWNSLQYAAGHGLVQADPIKWSWDLTGSGAASFIERPATDTTGCNTFNP